MAADHRAGAAISGRQDEIGARFLNNFCV